MSVTAWFVESALCLTPGCDAVFMDEIIESADDERRSTVLERGVKSEC